MAAAKRKAPPASSQATAYRLRVRGLALLPPERIEPAPLNWRTHDEAQRAALRGLFGGVGVAGSVHAWIPDDTARAELRALPAGDLEAFAAWLAKRPDLRVRLFDGHLRHEELRQETPVLVTDLDEQEAAVMLATFDPVSALAGADAALLGELLADVAPPAGAEDLVDELLDFAAPAKRPKGREAKISALTDIQPQFYLAARGPLPAQPDAIERLRAALAELPGVQVDVGLMGPRK